MTAPSEVRLDNPESYRLLDPGDMFRRVNDLPEQIETAWELASRVELPPAYRSVDRVIICGMGGSAIGGSLVETYGAHDIPVPVAVWRNYGLPAWVNESALVIAVSYSGNTEETISAMQEARRRGAPLATITTGGTAARLAGEWGIPSIQFSYPAQPRATLGYLFTPLLCLFERLGFLPSQEEHVREAIDVARQCRSTWDGSSPAAGNFAKQLAEALRGRCVVVYGADFLGAVARRWKTQLNENAKSWAFYEELPELDHNAIVGYEYPQRMPEMIAVVVLNSSLLPERIRVRTEVTAQVLDRYSVPRHQVDARGAGRLAQMVSLIALGDYVSYYLALLNGVDPTAIEPIDFLKQALSRAQ
ncbi:MAG TPA: bifunctional phosphoglucose/phosphomannose isomerase [Chloroflexota bacterium]|nr:bifunctional phosphoglucose/phosphomannose isomerase [Chloroflexota bacterium]